MFKKPTKSQLLWLLYGLLSTIYSSVSGCNTTLTINVDQQSSKIPIPNNSSYCLWKLELSTPSSRDLSFYISLRDVSLEDCEKCKCEYIEIWDTDWSKDPKHSVGRFCRRTGKITTIRGKRVLIEYSSSKVNSTEKRQRFLQYEWVYNDYTRPSTIVWDYYTDDDHHHDDKDHHGHDHDSKGLAITTTAIGILLSLIILIGALACGICIVQFLRPKQRRRQRRQRRQPSVLQTPVSSGLPKLPHLPNYFENEFGLPPPYLETTGANGNPVSVPNYYDNPPPYSILDTESKLETTGDTRASDRMNRSRR